MDCSINSNKFFCTDKLFKIFYIIFDSHAEICRFLKEIATPQTVGLFMIWRVSKMPHEVLFIPPPLQTLFVVGILFSRCPCVRACVRPSVTFCFVNILKSHCWIFIKPCKHVHIYKTKTLNKKVRARGQFYLGYFPL